MSPGTAQCGRCGRVLVAGDWKWDDAVAVSYIGSCPTCARLETARQDREHQRQSRALLRGRARAGQGEQYQDDPFKGVV